MKESLEKNFRKGLVTDPFRISLARDLTPEQVLRFKERELSLKGAQVDVELIRYYPFGKLASHVLGYTQAITPKELKYLLFFRCIHCRIEKGSIHWLEVPGDRS